MRAGILSVVLAVSAMAGTEAAANAAKELDCKRQANVVSGVQQARLGRVPERKVYDLVAAAATWPEAYNKVIPLVTPWVYEMKMKDVKSQNLAAAWKELCLARKE